MCSSHKKVYCYNWYYILRYEKTVATMQAALDEKEDNEFKKSVCEAPGSESVTVIPPSPATHAILTLLEAGCPPK